MKKHSVLMSSHNEGEFINDIDELLSQMYSMIQATNQTPRAWRAGSEAYLELLKSVYFVRTKPQGMIFGIPVWYADELPKNQLILESNGESKSAMVGLTLKLPKAKQITLPKFEPRKEKTE